MNTKSHPGWLLLAPFAMAWLSASELDPGFGTNGVASTAIGIYGANGRKTALQSDNKIVAVGYTMSGMDNRFLIMRFHPDGALDTSFGAAGTGIVVEHFTANTTEDAYSVLVLPDDSIAVVGRGIKPDGNATLAQLKLTASGLPDTTFNGTGIFTTSFGDYPSPAATRTPRTKWSRTAGPSACCWHI